MASGAELAATPVDDIVIGRSVVLGWLDGPTEGFLQVAAPASTWRFQLHADVFNPRDMDDRLYALSPVPDDTISTLLDALGPLGPPSSLRWVPVWDFHDDEDRYRAEAAVRQMTERAGPAEVLVESTDLASFTRVWHLVSLNGAANS